MTKNVQRRDFPGGPVVKTPSSQRGGHGFNPWFNSVQLLSHVQLFATPQTAACQASLSIINSELAPTHVHRVGDAIQPSHHLSSPSPAFSLTQHQGLFRWVSSSHQVAKVLESQVAKVFVSPLKGVLKGLDFVKLLPQGQTHFLSLFLVLSVTHF